MSDDEQDDRMSAEDQRQARKDAAAQAAMHYSKAFDRHKARYLHDMTSFEAAEAAITAKEKAEAEFGVKMSASVDVQGQWWFQ